MCVAVCYRVLQSVAVSGRAETGRYFMVQCVAVCCSVLESVAVC